MAAEGVLDGVETGSGEQEYMRRLASLLLSAPLASIVPEPSVSKRSKASLHNRQSTDVRPALRLPDTHACMLATQSTLHT